MSAQHKNPDNVARGYKATISNPNVSEEAKQNAARHLQEMGVSVDVDATRPAAAGGHATTTKKSPQAMMEDISRKPNEYAEGVIAGDIPEVNADVFVQPGDEDEDVVDPNGPNLVDTSPGDFANADKGSESRVMGGYKAALHNPRVSKEAKQHAEQVLREHGADY